MKIAKVEIRKAYPDYSLAANANMRKFTGGYSPIFVRIYADDGTYGDGESGLGFGSWQSVEIAYLQQTARLIIGQDPLDVVAIWNKIFRLASFRDWLSMTMQSAIDIALWDLKGKLLGVPVYKLLGGAVRKKVRAYASQLQFGWKDWDHMAVSVDDYANASKEAVKAGFDAVKIDFWAYNDKDGAPLTHEDRKGMITPKNMRMIEDRVAAVREAIGPDNDILLEGHGFLDVTSAQRIAQRLEKYDIAFFEEPCQVDAESYRRVKEKTSIPIAGGERFATRWDFAPYFQRFALDIAQPDVSNCGGITEMMRIGSMAEVYEVDVQGHHAGSHISLAATLHVEAALPNFAIHEFHMENYQKYITDLCTEAFIPENGYITVPEAPGLGTELSEYTLKHSDLITVE